MQNATSTRERLIEVAADRFWRQGFSATSLAQIAADADAHGGSIYHFFRSKERLVLAVLDHFDALLEGAIFEPALKKYSDPIDRIFGVLEVYRAFLEETECAMGCPIGNMALEVSDGHPVVRQKVAAIFDRWCVLIVDQLDQARTDLPADLDREGLAMFVLTVMEGGLMQAKAQRDLAPFDASVAHLRRYFDDLLEKSGLPTDQSPQTEKKQEV